jgi:hypothetical protein
LVILQEAVSFIKIEHASYHREFRRAELLKQKVLESAPELFVGFDGSFTVMVLGQQFQQPLFDDF